MPLIASPPRYVVNPMPVQITKAQVKALLKLDTGTIGHVLDAGFMDQGLQQQMPGRKLAGTAITVRCTLPDSVMGHYALKFARPGDILVIDRGQDQMTACWGAATRVEMRVETGGGRSGSEVVAEVVAEVGAEVGAEADADAPDDAETMDFAFLD
jgi:hypothetical protein